MPAGILPVIVCDPPIQEWTGIVLPWFTNIQRLDVLEMPYIQEFYCDNNPLTTLPWNHLTSLRHLGAYNSGLTTLPLWQLPDLQECYAEQAYNLTQIDAHGNSSLTVLDTCYSPLLTDVDLQDCGNLQQIFIDHCALDQTMVDQILSDLVANNTQGGYLVINGPNNAPPSNPYGVTLGNVLLSRGWTLYTS